MSPGLLAKYTRLIVKTGLNLQKNQTLVITSPLECAYFARLVAEAAYKEGAREVVMNWEDELSEKIRFMSASEDVFDEFPQWKKQFYSFYSKLGAAFFTVYASDPELMKGVDPLRMSRYYKAYGTGMMEYKERTSNFRNSWSVAAIPTRAWASKVFPELMVDKAVERLWEAISACSRLDADDPVTAWENHINHLKRNTEYLNRCRFRLLQYKNALGTDLTIELPQKHVWSSAPAITPEGLEIVANIPTEEIFTLPVKAGVNGKVVGSIPVVRNGSIIDEFYMTFKDGRIVDYDAQKGFETLKGLIETDAGSCYLGEVALVPYDSAVSKTNLLFWNMLFDENSSCHLALGNAYPPCFENGKNMSREELESEGVNLSVIHQDFMIGTKDLEVTGVTEENIEILIMKDGNFTF